MKRCPKCGKRMAGHISLCPDTGRMGTTYGCPKGHTVFVPDPGQKDTRRKGGEVVSETPRKCAKCGSTLRVHSVSGRRRGHMYETPATCTDCGNKQKVMVIAK